MLHTFIKLLHSYVANTLSGKLGFSNFILLLLLGFLQLIVHMTKPVLKVCVTVMPDLVRSRKTAAERLLIKLLVQLLIGI